MFEYNATDYASLFGRIEEEQLSVAGKCVSQCTGCTCSCRCSCSGGAISDVEWEEI